LSAISLIISLTIPQLVKILEKVKVPEYKYTGPAVSTEVSADCE
jgi:hypothetical protein